MSIFGLPLILFQIPSGLVADDEMSDIQYLAIKEFDGKTRKLDGSATGNGTLVTLTANVGKDMYLAGAKVNVFDENVVNVSRGTISLTINGIVEEICELGGTSNTQGPFPYSYKLKGIKVTTGQIIKLEITDFEGTPAFFGVLHCWEEDTGASPQEPPLEPV